MNKEQYDKIFEKGVYLTHVFRVPVNENVFMPLAFITQIEGNLESYLGFEFDRAMDKESIDKRVKIWELEQLAEKIPIKKTQTPYLSPKNEICLIDHTKPIDTENILVIRK
ncbi:hypothetical protein HZA33_04980 [Candidatus Pacearchaeota archaeon]|nr:hypothetical protein [Candidatus Pacearchaeota archaeon]